MIPAATRPRPTDQHAAAEPRGQHVTSCSANDAADGEWHCDKPGLQCAMTQACLPQQGDREEDAGEGREIDQREQYPARERRMGEKPWRDKRIAFELLQATFPQREERDEHGSSDHRHICPRRPAFLLAFDQRREQRHQARREQRQSEPIGCAIRTLGTTGEKDRCRANRNDSDRDVDAEDQPPSGFGAESLDDQSADQRAKGGRKANGRTKNRERAATRSVCEHQLDQGCDRREEHTAGQPLHHSGGDQLTVILGQAARQAGDGEERQARDEHPLVPQPIPRHVRRESAPARMQVRNPRRSRTAWRSMPRCCSGWLGWRR